MKYDPSRLNRKEFLTDQQRHDLGRLNHEGAIWNELQQNPRMIDEVGLDFVHASSKVEGNQYSRLETEILLKIGITAGGKPLHDALMLKNLDSTYRRLFSDVVMPGSDLAGRHTAPVVTEVSLGLAKDLHAKIMRGLLPDYELGTIRQQPVTIGASSYHPLDDVKQLRAEVDFLFAQVKSIESPFDRAIYMGLNMSYLQFFPDGNKRTARFLQNTVLAQAGQSPLFFHVNFVEDYLSGLLQYYETGASDKFVDFFLKNYIHTYDNHFKHLPTARSSPVVISLARASVPESFEQKNDNQPLVSRLRASIEKRDVVEEKPDTAGHSTPRGELSESGVAQAMHSMDVIAKSLAQTKVQTKVQTKAGQADWTGRTKRP